MGIQPADRLQLRKDIFRKIKKQVQLYLGDEPEDIRRYAKAYKLAVEGGSWELSSRDVLYDAILSADIVFGGDFHSFAQAQKSHLRILREIAPRKRVTLALECVPSKYQNYLQDYMSDEISEDYFLDKVDWVGSWGFPWEHYRQLIREVKAHGGDCVALNQIMAERTEKDLNRRDEHAAGILRRLFAEKNDDEVIYVIYGDLHVARAHIPKYFHDGVKGAPKSLSIYLNPEKIYFELVQQDKAYGGNVLKLSETEYCLLESPPWVKWQSYLLFLEENIDTALDEEDSQLDYTEHIQSLMGLINADLEIEAQLEQQVYSFFDHEFLELVDQRLDGDEFQLVKSMVESDLSFFYPKKDILFLSRATVNYAADLAGHVIHSDLSGRQALFSAGEAHYIHNIWIETMAFFLSKFVNPHRKAMNLNDLRKLLAAFSQDQGEEALRLALDQKLKELLIVYGDQDLKEKRGAITDEMSYLKAAKILGAYHGERIFKLYRSGRLSRDRVLGWLREDVEGGEFYTFYYQVLKELDTIELGETYG